jgi:hypothetical protein
MNPMAAGKLHALAGDRYRSRGNVLVGAAASKVAEAPAP